MIGARENNGVGIVGVAPGARMMALRACWQIGADGATLCDSLVLLRDGEVVAAGATDVVLTTEHLRRVYGVDTEISRHPSGQRIVIPLRRAAQPRP